MRRARAIPTGRRLRTVALVPLVALALVASGCTKMTGGGWIPSLVAGQKATFGFTAKCKTERTVLGLPTAVLHEGQFQFHDQGLDVSVHGTVVPLEFLSVSGMTCRELAASDPNLLGFGQFAGTYRTQPGTTPSHHGEFLVQVADGPTVDLISGELVADGICVDLFGLSETFEYLNCGELQGGHIKVE